VHRTSNSPSLTQHRPLERSPEPIVVELVHCVLLLSQGLKESSSQLRDSCRSWSNQNRGKASVRERERERDKETEDQQKTGHNHNARKPIPRPPPFLCTTRQFCSRWKSASDSSSSPFDYRLLLKKSSTCRGSILGRFRNLQQYRVRHHNNSRDGLYTVRQLSCE
jgi:hypothetical protein